MVQSYIRYLFPILFNASQKKFKLKYNGKILNFIVGEDKKCKQKIFFFSNEEIDFDYIINSSGNFSKIIIDEVSPDEWCEINIYKFLKK